MDRDYISKRNSGRGDGITLLIYRLKMPFQYFYTLKEFIYQDNLFHYCLLKMKDISS